LAFWTGASSIPLLGFPGPVIGDERPADKPLLLDFFPGDDGRLPYSSTCGLTLWLPVACDQQEFNERLTMAFTDCVGFGKL